MPVDVMIRSYEIASPASFNHQDRRPIIRTWVSVGHLPQNGRNATVSNLGDIEEDDDDDDDVAQSTSLRLNISKT